MNEDEIRETLVEAFGDARVVNSDFVALEGGWTAPRDDEAERMADVALEVFRRATAKPACATEARGVYLGDDRR
jgi:hypothetical protein